MFNLNFLLDRTSVELDRWSHLPLLILINAVRINIVACSVPNYPYPD